MCHRCEASDLCDRIMRQVQAIDGDGAISPEAVRALLVEAHKRLSAYVTADGVFDMIVSGRAQMEVVEIAPHGRRH